MKKLTFSLDYDDTFTADPRLWRDWTLLAINHGHSVYCVTARQDSESNLQEIKHGFGCPIIVVMTSGQQKRQFCIDSGLRIDVWIDDAPDAIVGDWESLELNKAYDEIERLGLLVLECREQRDNAESAAKQSVQSEMAALRSEIASLKSKVAFYVSRDRKGI